MATTNPTTSNAASGRTRNNDPVIKVEIADLTRWRELFFYGTIGARKAILAHRQNPSLHISNEQWAWVQWGHEQAGYDKEAYEHLLQMKKLAKREEDVKAKKLSLYEQVGQHARICLEGCVTLGTLIYFVKEEDIGTVDSEEKWCYIKHDRVYEIRIKGEILRSEVAVTKGRDSYNQAWNDVILPPILTRAGFHSIQPQSQSDGNNLDIRVNFLRLDFDQPGDLLDRAINLLHPNQDSMPGHQPRPTYSITELARLRLPPPSQAFPTSRQDPILLVPGLPSWDTMGMYRFYQRYRSQFQIQLPVFGNAPRVFSPPGEVVTAMPPNRYPVRSSRYQSVAGPEALPVCPPRSHRQIELSSPIRNSSKTHADRRPKLEQLRKRRALLYQNLSEILMRSQALCIEAFSREEPPRTVSDMMVRELVKARNRESSGSLYDKYI
ncbi:hypothetical protein VTL71DRAFT_6530 [Oculimacula yallundae]|uniref:Uncharacterized protein n=1 Tax=Oculimacula yallundae TaxID=86028 RepID=A0ABR4BX75_9HELO